MGRVRSRFLILTDSVFFFFFLELSPSPLTFGSWVFFPKGRGAVTRGKALDPGPLSSLNLLITRLSLGSPELQKT